MNLRLYNIQYKIPKSGEEGETTVLGVNSDDIVNSINNTSYFKNNKLWIFPTVLREVETVKFISDQSLELILRSPRTKQFLLEMNRKDGKKLREDLETQNERKRDYKWISNMVKEDG